MGGWHRSAEELAGRHEQQIKTLVQDNQNLVAHIDVLEMNLASLISRVDQMEDKLCRCGKEKVLSSFALSLSSTSDEIS